MKRRSRQFLDPPGFGKPRSPGVAIPQIINTTTYSTEDMTKKLSEHEKIGRRPASRACTFCHRKHLQCSNERPCKNCVKRNIAGECRDIERKKAKYLRPESTTPKKERSAPVEVAPAPRSSSGLPTAPLVPMQTFPESINTTDEVLSKLFSTQMKQTNSDIYDNLFDSNYLDQEYKMLGDIITNSKPTSPTNSGTEDESMAPSFISPVIINEEKLKETRPFISLGVNEDELKKDIEAARESNNMSVDIASHLSNDTNNYVSPMVSHQLYKTVPDIYANDIIYFDYPQSYHSLTHFLKTRFSGKDLSAESRQAKRNNLLIILKLIASYRPTFISAHKSLYKPWDLQFLEMTFQRSLLDFEKLLNLNSSPTVIWRRTGEIVSISNDLISLLGWNINEMLSKRTFIMELMFDDESIINYFKLFKSVAVGNLHSSINTRCKLMRRNGNAHDDFIEFCCVWTVKRDIFDIPMLILGQFLPILSHDTYRSF